MFTKNRDRLLTTEMSRKIMAAILTHREVAPLLSGDHFSVDGTRIRAWASMKSFKPKAEDTPPDEGPSDPPSKDDAPAAGSDTPTAETKLEIAPMPRANHRSRNVEVDFRGEKRSNATHVSTTDPEARLYKKAPGTGAVLCFMGHALRETLPRVLLRASCLERQSDRPTVQQFFLVRAETNAESVLSNRADLGEARQDSQDAAPGGTAVDADKASPEVDAFFEALLCRMPAGYVYNERFNAIVDREGCPICGPLRVVSFPRRLDGSDYAAAVEFVARDGRLWKATIAQADLTQDAFLSRLIDLGLARYSSAVFVA